MGIPSIFNSRSVNPDGTPVREHKTTLGQEDFLKILVTKMSSQDPMNPQGDADFIAQMAQFSSLEQTRAMSADMGSLRAQQEILTASGLIGRNVTLTDGTTEIGKGIVGGVEMEDGLLTVMVDGKPYELSQITSITPPVAIS